ncbi:MAG: FAD binding domain-containing protein [bacterium]
MADIERYERPASLAEAVALLRGGEVTVLAGGTDLMPQTRAGARAFRPVLMNITRLPELRGIEEKAGAIRIGALTTITEILDSPLVGGRLPVLAQAAGCFASDQLRNWATVGGNIANASPAGDMIVPLLLLDAELELAGAGEGGGGQGTVESRRVALKDFFTGPGQSRLEPHEILVAIHLPRPVEGFVAGFEKFGARPALDISLVSVGIAGVRGNGALTNARVALGAVAPTPMRATRSEAALEGRPLDDEAIQAVAETAAAEIDPISDVRGSAWYRRQLVANLSKRILRGVS